LHPHDEVNYLYTLTSDTEGLLAKSIETQVDMLDRLLKQKLVIGDETDNVLIKEEQDVNGAKFMLTFVRKSLQ